MEGGDIVTDRRFFASRRMGVAASVATLLTTVTYGVGLMTDQAPPADPVAQPGIVQNEPHRPTSLEQVESTFGPFEPILVRRDTPTPDTAAPAVLLFGSDGGTKTSTAWKVSNDETQWQRNEDNSFYIRGFEVNLGYVTVLTANSKTFVVKASQAFVLADDPSTVCMITADGTLYTLTTTRADGLRQPLK